MYKMAYCYWRVFGKPPGYSGASNFFMAVQKVSFILDVKIGEDIIKLKFPSFSRSKKIFFENEKFSKIFSNFHYAMKI